MYVVFCNCPPDRADDLARALVRDAGVACVNVIPGVRSVYRWQGAIAEDVESTLVIKVAAALVDSVREAIVARHPYEVPEVIALPVDVARSHAPYVAWVRGDR